jgi:hypothetical protein
MAISAAQGPNGGDVAALLRTAPEKYTSLGTLLKYNKPDNRDLLIETYGDQGITGFLEMVGAVRSAGTADQIQYWEEGRLHKTISGFYDVSAGEVVLSGNNNETAADLLRLNDVLLTPAGVRLVVTGIEADTDGATATDYPAATVVRLDGASHSGSDEGSAGDEVTFPVIGNIYAQGTGQPTKFYDTDVTKRTNDFFITKETFHVNGSQATNIGWINVGNGDYRWYVKGEMDARKRFLNQREMMMMLSERVSTAGTSVSLASGVTTGSEGYFSAIEDRGITATGTFANATTGALAEFDEILLLLDAQGAPSEYAMYVDLQTSLDIDDMLASGIATGVTAGLAGQFGAFNNDADMAVQLGFKSFTRGGYTFHKHDWRLLNDPTLLGATGQKFNGVMTPMSKVADARTGAKSYALEMNYKEANGYSRDVEHWVEGGGVLGFATNDQDVAKFHYRSEAALITRAANQHVLIKAS